MEQHEKGLFAYIYVLCQFLGHTTLLAVELMGMENFGCEITKQGFFFPQFCGF